MTAHLTDPSAVLTEGGGLPSLVASARYEKPHTRALRIGMERHGPTPLYDAVRAAFAAQAARPARTRKPRPSTPTMKPQK